MKVQVVGKDHQPLQCTYLLLMRRKLNGFNGEGSRTKTNKILLLFPGSTVTQHHSLEKKHSFNKGEAFLLY